MSFVPQPSLKGLITNLILYGSVLAIPSLFFLYVKNNSAIAISIFLGGIYGSIVMINFLKLINWWMTGEWKL